MVILDIISYYLWSVFPTTEAGFSSLLAIKIKQRNKLESEGDLRCTLSKTNPRLTELVAKKQKQVSH